ncbi:hypothetical protein I4U23_016492 [Adineta vaga]|nr:hypothetical protein I4U23_016492 [Adineta vaga]
MTLSTQQIRIIAEPKASYRERYGSEQDKTGNRTQRYIRAECRNQFKLEYPTVEIPAGWRDTIHHPYIRVTSVTVSNEGVPTVCVHPYPIDSDGPNVWKDPANNALYFPITNEDFIKGRKSFLVTRKKLVQNELKLHGYLHIINSDQRHIPLITNKPLSRQLIKIYKLWKSQLIFSLTDYIDNNVFNIFPGSSVSSQVMSDESNQQRDVDAATSVVTTNNPDKNFTICVPERGNWVGGDKVLMVLPKLDRKNAFHVYFDFSELNQKINIQYELVDMKTITFQTPACLLAPGDQSRTVPIITIQNEKVIGKFNFFYISPSILPTTNMCSTCQLHASSTVVRLAMSNKRPCPNSENLLTDQEFDWE